jgi:hypothetical protein
MDASGRATGSWTRLGLSNVLCPQSLQGNSVRHEICQVVPSLVPCVTMNTKQSTQGKAKKSAVGEGASPVGQGFKYVRLVGTL